MSEPRINNEALKRLAFKEEPRFLSILLKDKECLMDAVSFGIKGGSNGHFWNAESKFLYEIMHSYYLKHGSSLTRVAMDSIMDSMEEYGGKPIDDDIRTKARISWDKTYNLEASSEDYTLLRDNINARYVQWQAVNIVKSSLDELVKSTNSQVEVVRKVREKFITIDNMEGDSYTLIMDVEEGMEKTLAHIENRRENPEDLPTIPTGLRAIDDVYHGLEYGSYTIISGMINGGKTTLMFNIGFNMARAGYNVVYVSLEKKAVPLFTRLLSLHALVDYNRIKRGGKGERG
jgi:replicative DNA helicase